MASTRPSNIASSILLIHFIHVFLCPIDVAGVIDVAVRSVSRHNYPYLRSLDQEIDFADIGISTPSAKLI